MLQSTEYTYLLFYYQHLSTEPLQLSAMNGCHTGWGLHILCQATLFLLSKIYTFGSPSLYKIDFCTAKRERCSYFLLDEANLRTAAKVTDGEEEEEEEEEKGKWKGHEVDNDIVSRGWVNFGNKLLH